MSKAPAKATAAASAQSSTPTPSSGVDDTRNDGDNDNDGDDGEGDGEGDTSDEEAIEPKILPKRTTRGQRINTVAKEGDEEFWQQDAFKEEEKDDDYVSESEDEDLIDADFDDVEDQSSDDEVRVEKEGRGRKKGYQEPRKRATAKKSKKDEDTHEAVDVDETEDGAKKAGRPKKVAMPRGMSPVRKSGRSATMERSAEVQEKERARKAQPRKTRVVVPSRVLSQDEQYAIAIETERENKASLAALEAIEEERKKVPVKRSALQGPGVLWHSARNANGTPVTSITFTRTADYPDLLRQKPPPPGPNRVCVITGLPAKYLDPKTRLPYATAAAFKQLRAQYAAGTLRAGPSPIYSQSTGYPASPQRTTGYPVTSQSGAGYSAFNPAALTLSPNSQLPYIDPNTPIDFLLTSSPGATSYVSPLQQVPHTYAPLPAAATTYNQPQSTPYHPPSSSAGRPVSPGTTYYAPAPTPLTSSQSSSTRPSLLATPPAPKKPSPTPPTNTPAAPAGSSTSVPRSSPTTVSSTPSSSSRSTTPSASSSSTSNNSAARGVRKR